MRNTTSHLPASATALKTFVRQLEAVVMSALPEGGASGKGAPWSPERASIDRLSFDQASGIDTPLRFQV
ncbi:hypothetical protein [Microbacterium sp. LTA6]|uniref:hypothetical protein n=1 Tax=Microbacterium sp. LTA6 TaxID=3129771 RepID=UPI00388F2E5E